MRILITGGKGFIGSHCVEHFLEQGDDVLVLDHDRAGIYYDSANYASVNLAQDVEALEDFIYAFRPQAVVHLAAWSNVRESMSNPSKLYAYNVQTTANLVEVLLALDDLESLVFASSSAADDPESHYGVSKLTGELMLDVFQHQRPKTSVACLRFGNVYGLRQNPRHGTLISRSIERLITGLPIQIYGDGSQMRDYIHVADIVDAIEICVQKGVSGVHNASTGIVTMTKAVADVVGGTYHRITRTAPLTFEAVPARSGDKQTVAMEPSPVLESHGFGAGKRYLRYEIREQIAWRLQMKGSWDYPLTPKGENVCLTKSVVRVSSLDEWLRLGGRL